MSNLIPTRKEGALKTNTGFTTLPSLSSWVDDLFNKNFGTEFMSNFNTGITLPSVNIKDTEDSFVLDMAVPGLKKSDFDISIDNYLLSISANSKTEETTEKDTYTRREFGYASFKRSFTLPETVDTDKIKATYTDGLLQVTIPKREEAKRKPIKSIEIS